MGVLARRQLWEVAVDQHGYFTLDDAQKLGISQPTVAMLAHRGTLEHLARGVYRFVDLPASPASPNLAVVLWTGQPRACLSHDTALNELCDINPGRIHVTVPKGRRIRCKKWPFARGFRATRNPRVAALFCLPLPG